VTGPGDLDIAANRRSRKWSRGELVGRVLWGLCSPLFRFSPRLAWGWRRVLLRLFGARIGAHVHIHATARIFVPWNLEVGDSSSIGDHVRVYDLGPVSLGRQVTVSHGVHLCAGSHDHRRADLPLTKPPIRIGDGAWICADAFIGPGVTVGDYAIVAARAVAVRDVAAWKMVGGNPARVIGERPPLERS
jgi:putative colanic acid biosynthesis acetyltransferase WcaF